MEKLERTNISGWFTYKKLVKAKYAHVMKLSPQVETRKYNSPFLEN
jgi:hypothetical protein